MLSRREGIPNPLEFSSNPRGEDSLLPGFIDLPDVGRIAVASVARAASFDPERIRVARGSGRSGTLVLCEVVETSANRLETTAGTQLSLRPHDIFIGVLANRFSTQDYFGGLPAEGIGLPPGLEYDLMATGGVIGTCRSFPSHLSPPGKIKVLGALVEEGRPDRLLSIDERLTEFCDESVTSLCPVLFICGTSANVGKTTFGTALVHHLSTEMSSRVAVAKVAGTGGQRDLYELAAAGAHDALGFVDGGLATTYTADPATVVGVVRGVLNRLAASSPDCIVAECGGDLLGGHVDAILEDPSIQRSTRALIVISSDAIAAYGAKTLLRELRYPREPWFAIPGKNAAATQWRANLLFDGRILDGASSKDLHRVCSSSGLGQETPHR